MWGYKSDRISVPVRRNTREFLRVHFLFVSVLHLRTQLGDSPRTEDRTLIRDHIDQHPES